MKESYNTREGEGKFYDRIAQKDHKDKTLKGIYKLLQKSALSYLLHHYQKLLDKVYWQQYLNETDAGVVWMD